jgi:regulator of RNase E activity RraA
MNTDIDAALFEKLALCDSCSVANAVDATGMRLSNEGFSDSRVACRTPGLRPMVGTVVTLKVRSADPPMKTAFYLDHPDWWELLTAGTMPRILAVEDVDARPGKGSLVGPVHACILKALGFVGVVTNGAIRGRSSFESIGLNAYAGNVSPSHAFSHVVEAGVGVEIAGLRLAPGDLLHGDANGIVSIPSVVAAQVALAAAEIREREKRICHFCASGKFSKEALRARMGVDSSRR